MIITLDFTTPTGRPSKVRHGEYSAYMNYGCRCPECTQANTDYCAARRISRSASATRVPHGTAGGYRNYNCRCDLCRSANAEHASDYRRRRKHNAELAARS